MSVEPKLSALITPICEHFFWDEAEEGMPTPYVVAQAVGGKPLRALDGTAANIRNTAMRVTVWAGTRKESTELSRRIEDVLSTASAFRAEPLDEAISLRDPTTKLFGAAQIFSLWADR